LLQIYREVKARGRTMQFWGDIIMAHPELATALPRDVIALEWGYDAEHPFADHGAKFAASGVPFYVCPGTSSWNTVAGRTDNALGNLRSAAENGLEHGAVGYLNTDWGDNGHWQPLPVSYLGYAAGAAFSWAYAANRELDLAEVLSRYAFWDGAGVIGRLVYDLGNAYLQTGLLTPNSTSLFHILQNPPEKIAGYDQLTAANLQKTLAYLDQVLTPLTKAQINRPDADLIRRELSWAAAMLRHACRRGRWALGREQDQEEIDLRRQLAQEADQLLAEHRKIWLARNRPGGFKDSQARLEKMKRDYDPQT
ncbi:MAG: glycoside hydrolase, partial [Anaerolineae bacterium]|nr:glycoside hydrolase [Anaerolineae bacterium]